MNPEKTAPRIVSDQAVRQLDEIHQLSRVVNAAHAQGHARVLLDFIAEHATEIRQLYERHDPHYLVETGDLMILCAEVLHEAGESCDAILEQCFERFRAKLNQVRAQQNKGSDHE